MQDLYNKYLSCEGVSIDTRTVLEGQMFFAIKGEKFDANDYIDIAIQKGAKYIVTDQSSTLEKFEDAILVNDVIESLQNLASYHRDQFDIPFIGITGSNGKTTTKELINVVLSKKYNTYATKGNLNNHLGVPLTLLSIKKDCEIAIVEMGANHVGEIDFLCNICKPTHGIITNIGKAHLEGFGSLNGVIQAKTELYKSLENHRGVVFFNEKSEILSTHLPSNTSNIPYGNHIEIKESFPFLRMKDSDQEFVSHLIGDYNAVNISCSIAVGRLFEVPEEYISSAISNYNPTMNRSQIIDKKNFKVISDAYNANPISMNAAISNFKNIEHDNKILIIGDMLELGDYSKIEHQKIVDSLMDFEGQVFLVGKCFMDTTTSFNKYPNIDLLKENENLSSLFNSSLLLIKGSRGIALEKLLEDFE